MTSNSPTPARPTTPHATEPSLLHRGRWRLDRDRGSVGLFMAILMVGLLPLAGLVVDGGAALAARGRAADLADQAARSAADALNPASLRGASPATLSIDPSTAVTAAQDVLSSGGATGAVSVQGQTVTVTAHVPRRAVILSAVGITDLTGTATATATILHGTTTARP